MKLTKKALLTASALLCLAAAVHADDKPLYKVVDGYKVDANTLVGFRTWRSAACDRCHGANQEGLVGPSLINSLKTLTKDEFVQTHAEKFSVWSGVLNTAGGLSCYGTLEGYLKCVDKKNINKELYKFKTPSGIIGNVFTYEHKGKQYIGVFSGIGGWAGIGMAAGLEKDQEGLGAVGGYKELAKYTELGGSLTVFALPN